MSFLRKLFGRGGTSGRSGQPRRRPPPQQLLRLEQALDALATEMRAEHTMDDPGWRGRVNEYSRLAGEAMDLASGTPTRERCWIWSSRFAGLHRPDSCRHGAVGPLQDEVMAAADDLRELLPGEKG